MRGNMPTGFLRQRIRSGSTLYSLSRREQGDEASYGSGVTYTEDAASASLWLFAPTETPTIVDAGEVVDGGLRGLALPDEADSLEQHDRLTHGSREYELTAIDGVPDENTPVFYSLNFTVV